LRAWAGERAVRIGTARFADAPRSWITQGGIEKPLMNAYRLFAMLGRRRLPAESDQAFGIDDLSGREYGMPEEVDALASIADDGTVAALVWRHCDDQYAVDGESAAAVLVFAGLAADVYTATEYRIDADHSNSHTVWEAMGSPQDLDEATLAAIHLRQGLETIGHPCEVEAADGALRYETTLPLPSVSLVVLQPR
jgi:xylan 1,4-beta-xylosidase